MFSFQKVGLLVLLLVSTVFVFKVMADNRRSISLPPRTTPCGIARLPVC